VREAEQLLPVFIFEFTNAQAVGRPTVFLGILPQQINKDSKRARAPAIPKARQLRLEADTV
jgi:hypothetical protein